MPPKRRATDQDGDGFVPRKSKCLRGETAATSTAPDDGSLENLVAGLLQHIQDMPPNSIIVGLDTTLKNFLNANLLATPGFYNHILEYINSQITTLTEATETGKIEARYALVTEGMLVALKGKLKHISMVC